MCIITENESIVCVDQLMELQSQLEDLDEEGRSTDEEGRLYSFAAESGEESDGERCLYPVKNTLIKLIKSPLFRLANKK